jgi:hypothetical protein
MKSSSPSILSLLPIGVGGGTFSLVVGGLPISVFSRLLPSVLTVLDDFGLRQLRAPGPEDLYDVINERYEKASIVLTSNRDRAEWPDLFGEALLASAALDRLTHGAHFVEITGASFRAEHTKKQARALASATSTPRSRPPLDVHGLRPNPRVWRSV